VVAGLFTAPCTYSGLAVLVRIVLPASGLGRRPRSGRSAMRRCLRYRIRRCWTLLPQLPAHPPARACPGWRFLLVADFAQVRLDSTASGKEPRAKTALPSPSAPTVFFRHPDFGDDLLAPQSNRFLRSRTENRVPDYRSLDCVSQSWLSVRLTTSRRSWDVVAQRWHTAHPHALALRGGDLVPDSARPFTLALELREGQQDVECKASHRGRWC